MPIGTHASQHVQYKTTGPGVLLCGAKSIKRDRRETTRSAEHDHFNLLWRPQLPAAAAAAAGMSECQSQVCCVLISQPAASSPIVITRNPDGS